MDLLKIGSLQGTALQAKQIHPAVGCLAHYGTPMHQRQSSRAQIGRCQFKTIVANSNDPVESSLKNIVKRIEQAFAKGIPALLSLINREHWQSRLQSSPASRLDHQTAYFQRFILFGYKGFGHGFCQCSAAKKKNSGMVRSLAQIILRFIRTTRYEAGVYLDLHSQL